MTKKMESTFFADGFCYWNGPSRTLDKHERSQIHSEVKMKMQLQSECVLLPAAMKMGQTVIMESGNKELVITIKAIRYLARQNQAFRGATANKQVKPFFLNCFSTPFRVIISS